MISASPPRRLAMKDCVSKCPRRPGPNAGASAAAPSIVTRPIFPRRLYLEQRYDLFLVAEEGDRAGQGP
jgi:hypothetical protein